MANYQKTKLVLGLKKSKRGNSFTGKIRYRGKTLSFLMGADGDRPAVYTSNEGVPLIYINVYEFDDQENGSFTKLNNFRR